MPEYTGVPMEDDPDVITDVALDELMLRVEGFDPKEAHLEVAVLEVVSRINAETRSLGKNVPDSIWRYFGKSLVNVLPVEEDSSTLLSTWTFVDPAGYTLEDGTTVAFRIAGDTLAPFQVVGDHVALPGERTLANIPLRAVEAGSGPNGLGPATLELVDALAFVQRVEATTTASGGVDPESEAEYMDRLRDEMTLLTPRFVLAADAAVLARRVTGVHRAIGVDNYNPTDGTFNNEKMVTIAVVDEAGQSLSVEKRQEVRDYLNTFREVNFVIHVVGPVYTTVNIVFGVKSYVGFDLEDLRGRCISALQQYLDPAVWAGGGESPPVWRTDDKVVRYLEVAQVLNLVEGVHYVTTLQLNGGTTDVGLGGVASLPTVGSITGTATNG